MLNLIIIAPASTLLRSRRQAYSICRLNNLFHVNELFGRRSHPKKLLMSVSFPEMTFSPISAGPRKKGGFSYTRNDTFAVRRYGVCTLFQNERTGKLSDRKSHLSQPAGSSMEKDDPIPGGDLGVIRALSLSLSRVDDTKGGFPNWQIREGDRVW